MRRSGVSGEMDDFTAVRKKLQNIIEHTDLNIATARRLSVEKWLKSNKQIANLKDDKLQFLYNVFRDEDCWSGTKLNNTILGQRLTVEKLNEVENPLPLYSMACRYSVKEKIKDFFQIMFAPYRSAFHSRIRELNGGRLIDVNDKYIRNHMLVSMKTTMNSICSFWIDRESEEFRLKEYSNVHGFQKAILIEWIEGVEYFYDRLNPREKEIEIMRAVTTLLSVVVTCEHNSAIVLDFCLHEMGNPSKRELFFKLSDENHGVYSLLSKLIRNRCFDTVQSLVKCFCYEEVSVSAFKTFSYRDYELLLSLLVRVILELLYRPELSDSAKTIIMTLWRCDRFNEHKKAAVNLSNGILPILSMASALAGLIIDWKRNGNESYVSFIERENDIYEILLFAKEFSSNENFMKLKENVVNILRIIGRPVAKEGIDRDIDYVGLTERLFNKVSNRDSSDEDIPYWL